MGDGDETVEQMAQAVIAALTGRSDKAARMGVQLAHKVLGTPEPPLLTSAVVFFDVYELQHGAGCPVADVFPTGGFTCTECGAPVIRADSGKEVSG